jgi:hypothetical protein
LIQVIEVEYLPVEVSADDKYDDGGGGNNVSVPGGAPTSLEMAYSSGLSNSLNDTLSSNLSTQVYIRSLQSF